MWYPSPGPSLKPIAGLAQAMKTSAVQSQYQKRHVMQVCQAVQIPAKGEVTNVIGTNIKLSYSLLKLLLDSE